MKGKYTKHFSFLISQNKIFDKNRTSGYFFIYSITSLTCQYAILDGIDSLVQGSEKKGLFIFQ
jgi:hypothetical protein